MSDSIDRFRTAMAKHLGGVMTPEVAAEIESYAFRYHDESIDPTRFAPHEYRGVVFQVESFRAIKDELHPLHEAHYAETEKARCGIPLKPRFEYALTADRRGELLQITAREGGVLVGHARFYLFDDIHSSTRAAKEDAYYIAPRARRGFTAIRMWQYAERCLAELGVIEVRTDSKIILDAHGNPVRNVGRLNEYLGYSHVSNGYLKRL